MLVSSRWTAPAKESNPKQRGRFFHGACSTEPKRASGMLRSTTLVAGEGEVSLDQEPPTARERVRSPESSHSGPLGAESRGAIAAVSLVAYPGVIVQPSRLSAGGRGEAG